MSVTRNIERERCQLQKADFSFFLCGRRPDHNCARRHLTWVVQISFLHYSLLQCRLNFQRTDAICSPKSASSSSISATWVSLTSSPPAAIALSRSSESRATGHEPRVTPPGLQQSSLVLRQRSGAKSRPAGQIDPKNQWYKPPQRGKSRIRMASTRPELNTPPACLPRRRRGHCFRP